MTEGTNVGNIFLDLIVRNTVEAQVQKIAAQGQATAQQAFSGVEKAAEKMANNAVAQTGKIVQKATEAVTQPVQKLATEAEACGKKVSTSIGEGFNKGVALAQAQVNKLEREYERVSNKLADVNWSYSYNDNGDKMTDKLAERLAVQREVLYDKLVSARERLAIQVQAAAEKQKAAEISAAQTTTVKLEAEAAKQRAAIAQAHTAADPPPASGAAAQLSVWQRLAAMAGKFGTVASNAFTRAGSAGGRLGKFLRNTNKRLNQGGKYAHRFGTRLKGIVSSALIFNGISLALRNMVSYFSKTIASTDEMKQALADLKGAAANAASPIIQVLTPALTALANTAATVLSYVERLLTRLTGKISNAAATAQKAAGAAKKATRSLAGFDEIERLGGDSDSSDGASIEPNYDFQGKSPFLDSVLSAINAGQWEQVGVLFAQKLNDSLASINWPNVHEKARQWTQNLVDTLNGFITKLDWGLVGSTIGNGLNTVFISAGTFVRGLKWGDLGKGVADMFMAGFLAINWEQLASDISTGIVGLFTAGIAFLTNMDWALIGITAADCLFAIDWIGILSKLVEFVASMAAGLIVTSVSFIARAAYKIGEKISKLFKEIGENGIQGFLNGMLSLLRSIGTWLYKHLVKPVIDGVKNALGIHSPSTVFAEIGENLVLGLLNGISTIWNSITEFFDKAFEKLKAAFTQTWNNISATVTSVVDGIKNKVTTTFASVKDSVTSIFNSVKDTVTTIWNNISSTIKGSINGIIGFINGMISGITSGINTVIRALNKLSFTIPDWLKHVPGAKNIAGKKFGFDIQTITAPQIPYLADGGVIKQPTLAMMGEYSGARNNPEIVTPQSVMAETVAAVMEDVIASNIAGFEAVVSVLREILEAILGIEIGDDVIGQAVERYNRKMAVVKGGT